jgi:hypothetical protein
MGVLPKIKTSNSTYLSKTKCEDGHRWWVSFEFYPLSVGETSTVFEGRMYNEHGYWSQSKATVKTLNNEIGSEDNLRPVVAVSEKARLLSQNFKNEFPKTKTIKFVMPCLAEMDSISVFNTPFRYIKGYEKQLAETEHVLIEELIEGEFHTFIDSKGAVCQESEVLNTFVHYSYVESNGDLVLCNIEGVQSDTNVKLSTATIHSRNRTFGSRDQGEQGILNVFKNHKCNNTCKNWPTPMFGFLPTASEFSESKVDSFNNCTRGLPIYVSQKLLTNPPSYEQSTYENVVLTNDRPLVHGQ